MYLAYLLAFHLVYLGISLEILCGPGPAGITLIQRWLLGPGGNHCDHELAVEVQMFILMFF